ncbi:SMP-30/gluconolactonase/LRE family protein [Kushneria phosphatilytica]|uniref:SMP-30/gluconolactonase/LRE family protein n=1 Tax=Kushneria phosphatilytica TaxID=657387 RepID=A0A1S1NX65_9GAMM|nr:SMP-30/gluconolactonase/LRE family protein [Kushneria phosphatilytica]OHV12846.1 gluconolactonase [Kushneria phosphatilytica]QEL10695.1 SMP-30/gluconolactonase/LRE family protein [Kushneria phosphatilytica]
MKYPDIFTIEDERFTRLILPNTQLEHLWSGGRWCEGPVYIPAGRYLLFSDIPNDRMLRFDETDQRVSVFRQPARFSNGNTLDREGRLISCEHHSRSVTRTEHDGSLTVLADRFEGKRFNSPNDVVVKSDGSIWFTDPSYGIDSDYEGGLRDAEMDCHVYRLGVDGTLTRVADDFDKPNGLAFSPDEQWLYIADTGATHHVDGPHHIRRFRVQDDHTLKDGEIFAECDYGLFDGFRIDTHGNLWSSSGGGVHCYAPDATLLGRIHVPEAIANVTFGGQQRNRLFICATTSLYAIYLNVRGCSVLTRNNP